MKEYMEIKEAALETRLQYQEITLADKPIIDAYMLPFGEKSCQHNFAALYALKSKYLSRYCVKDHILFIRQPAKDEFGYESCLMPIGQGNRVRALEELMSDTHKRGKKLKLQTITESAKAFLEEYFPGSFQITEERGFAEYLYRKETLELLSGRKMKKKRYYYQKFHKSYSGRLTVELLLPGQFPEVLAFQEKWLLLHQEDPGFLNLKEEDAAIRRVLSHYDDLGFKGITLRIDGHLSGFAMGCPISDNTFDMFFEKGDPEIKDIYRSLVTDMIKMHCGQFDFINREEDLDDPGLRLTKMSYKPDLLLKKYIARELFYE